MIEVILRSNRSPSNQTFAEDAQFYTVDGLNWRVLNRPRVWHPPTDVYENEDALVVRVEIAGMKEADFSISLTGRWLSISGFRNDQSERRAFHRMEIPFGDFEIELETPISIDENRVEAEYKDGFLMIILPRAHSHQIKIEE